MLGYLTLAQYKLSFPHRLTILVILSKNLIFLAVWEKSDIWPILAKKQISGGQEKTNFGVRHILRSKIWRRRKINCKYQYSGTAILGIKLKFVSWIKFIKLRYTRITSRKGFETIYLTLWAFGWKSSSYAIFFFKHQFALINHIIFMR